ncbi:MAG: aminotransferase class V-fold PLP-dependent enzyme [Candidatus Hydrogenedentota bacterium]|nr:MAG: aminotransferase class V-fold PLP-dependent enzyme [Candidatus Hydrogenedentota bacterium]
MKRIYLDANSTMPLRADVREFLSSLPPLGNPSSIHLEGRRARAVLEEARERIAAWAGVEPEKVIFTSGGTEANAAAVHGWIRRLIACRRRGSIVVNAGSHPSLWEPAGISGEFTRRAYCRNDYYPATDVWGGLRDGPKEQKACGTGEIVGTMPDDAVLVLETAASSETGALADLERSLEEARAHDAFLHIDAVQIPGKTACPGILRRADSFSLSGHKIGAPAGAGVLVVNEPGDWEPLIRGGGQEWGRRSGTPPVTAAAAFGFAIENLPEPEKTAAELRRRVGMLRSRIRAGIEAKGEPVSSVELSDETGLPGTLLLAFRPVPGDLCVAALDDSGIAASFGTACSSGTSEPSPALLRLGLSRELARSAVRFSLDWRITDADVEEAAARIVRTVRRLGREGGGTRTEEK